MSSASPESSQEFEYPPARVDQSFAGLDLNTLIMRSNAQTTQEVNPLEESTYEVVPLEDSVYGISDDEGHTASVASTTPDDASAFDEDDDDGDDDFEQEFVDGPPRELEPAVAEAPDDHTLFGGHDSTLTETPNMDGSEGSCVIRLQEEPGAEHDSIDACALSKEFTEAQISGGVLHAYGRSDLRLMVRAALSERHLPVPVDGSFKVLFIGNIEGWNKEHIQSRVHAALAASPGPSRSIMMRGQMEPYGPVVTTEHCSNIKLLEEAGKEGGIIVTLDSGSDLTIGTRKSRYNPDSTLLPNLVVFWYPQPILPTPEVDKFPVAREAFKRHHIPCLHIAAGRRFHLHPGGFADNKSLRFCVEGRDDDQSDFEQQETIPVDVYTFLTLEPSQLNRHLAALTNRAVARSPSNPVAPARAWGIRTFLDRVVTSMKENVSSLNPSVSSNTKKLLLIFAALCTMLTLGVLGTTFIPQLHTKYGMSDAGGKISGDPIKVVASGSPSNSAPTTSISKPVVSLASPVPIKSTAWDLTVVPTPQQPSRRKQQRKRQEKMGGFEIQATGEHRFMLSPSRDFAGRKRKPQLQIQVFKDGKTVPIEYVRTPEGAYMVHLEQEYPVGSFNVNITTHTKPLMQQSFAIIMGHNKSGFSRFIDAVKNDIAITQQGIRDLTCSLSKRVRAEIARLEDGTGDWKEKIDSSRREAAGHIQGAKKEAKRRLAAGTSFLRNIPGDTWVSLRKMTAPARTSRTTLRARNNAFRIRCGFERAVGLSSQGDGKKKTRSCKKIGW